MWKLSAFLCYVSDMAETETLAHAIGRRIQQQRAELGLSQRAMAQDLGVTHATIGQWERGESLPELERLIEVVRLLATRSRRGTGDMLTYIVLG